MSAIARQPAADHPVETGERHPPGATGASLVLTDLQPADAGEYTVVVTNPYGSQEAKATLTLVTPAKYAAAAADAGPIGYWRLDESRRGVTPMITGAVAMARANAGVTMNQAGPRPQAFKGFEGPTPPTTSTGPAARWSFRRST